MHSSTEGVLNGIVVCDFSWAGAGPIATAVLAQCGAEVIKIESASRPDSTRWADPFKDGVPGINRSGYFANRNANKKSLALNMNHPTAREVARRLISRSDVVINNFRVGQMEKWDLGWEHVKGINSRAIYVTMSLQGTSGPHSRYMGYGVNLNALCGLTARAAFEGKRAVGTGTNYTDHAIVPSHTLFGIMAALLERGATGCGQMVNISQLEAAISMVPTAPMTYAANGVELGPLGTGDPDAVPHGVYKTLGYRRWIAIAVFSDQEWRSLKEVMGHPVWAEDHRFSTHQDRLLHRHELDALIEQWTAGRYADWLMTDLVAHGVCAGLVRDGREAVEDDHLRKREFWNYLEHPEMGTSLYNRAPIAFSRSPLLMKSAAPVIGQHTEAVLAETLGYSPGEIAQMSRDGVLT